VPGSGRGSCARTSAGTCATAGWRAASASATSAEVYARGGVGAGQPFQIQTPDGQVAPPPPSVSVDQRERVCERVSRESVIARESREQRVESEWQREPMEREHRAEHTEREQRVSE
jgi:hypothetical protein